MFGALHLRMPRQQAKDDNNNGKSAPNIKLGPKTSTQSPEASPTPPNTSRVRSLAAAFEAAHAQSTSPVPSNKKNPNPSQLGIRRSTSATSVSPVFVNRTNPSLHQSGILPRSVSIASGLSPAQTIERRPGGSPAALRTPNVSCLSTLVPKKYPPHQFELPPFVSVANVVSPLPSNQIAREPVGSQPAARAPIIQLPYMSSSKKSNLGQPWDSISQTDTFSPSLLTAIDPKVQPTPSTPRTAQASSPSAESANKPKPDLSQPKISRPASSVSMPSPSAKDDWRVMLLQAASESVARMRAQPASSTNRSERNTSQSDSPPALLETDISPTHPHSTTVNTKFPTTPPAPATAKAQPPSAAFTHKLTPKTRQPPTPPPLPTLHPPPPPTPLESGWMLGPTLLEPEIAKARCAAANIAYQPNDDFPPERPPTPPRLLSPRPIHSANKEPEDQRFPRDEVMPEAVMYGPLTESPTRRPEETPSIRIIDENFQLVLDTRISIIRNPNINAEQQQALLRQLAGLNALVGDIENATEAAVQEMREDAEKPEAYWEARESFDRVVESLPYTRPEVEKALKDFRTDWSAGFNSLPFARPGMGMRPKAATGQVAHMEATPLLTNDIDPMMEWAPVFSKEVRDAARKLRADDILQRETRRKAQIAADTEAAQKQDEPKQEEEQEPEPCAHCGCRLGDPCPVCLLDNTDTDGHAEEEDLCAPCSGCGSRLWSPCPICTGDDNVTFDDPYFCYGKDDLGNSMEDRRTMADADDADDVSGTHD